MNVDKYDSQLDDVMQRFEWYKGKDESKWDNCLTKGEAKQQLQKLLVEVDRVARIDELNKLKLDTLSPENFGGKFIHEPVTEFASQQTEWIDERIKSLSEATEGK